MSIKDDLKEIKYTDTDLEKSYHQGQISGITIALDQLIEIILTLRKETINGFEKKMKEEYK